MCQFLNFQLFFTSTITGTIGRKDFFASKKAPGFTLCSGPVGPSGVIISFPDGFSENNSYKPSSPYAATKASSDHLVYSYFRTFKLPVIITNCSNNYGPNQHPEKLIPKLIYNIINNLPLRIYGNGKNSREWIYVEDHCLALFNIFKKGKLGDSYNIGSGKNLNNNQIAKALLKLSKKHIKIKSNVKIKYVKDSPGHDVRYALNSNKIKKNLNWSAATSFRKGLEKTFRWYLDNKEYFKFLNKRDIVKRLGKK